MLVLLHNYIETPVFILVTDHTHHVSKPPITAATTTTNVISDDHKETQSNICLDYFNRVINQANTNMVKHA